MDTFDKILELAKELLQSQLKVIYRHQRQSPQLRKKLKRTSNLDIVEDILTSVGQPLHISNPSSCAKRPKRGKNADF